MEAIPPPPPPPPPVDAAEEDPSDPDDPFDPRLLELPGVSPPAGAGRPDEEEDVGEVISFSAERRLMLHVLESRSFSLSERVLLKFRVDL